MNESKPMEKVVEYLKYRIHYGEDSIDLEGETIEDIQGKAFKEIAKRGWEEEHCWSEEIK